MFNQLFKKPYNLRRHLNAPLLEERLRYLIYLSEQGFKPLEIRDIASFQLTLIKYLQLEENKILTHKEITSASNRWALYSMRKYRYKNASYSSCKKVFIRRAMQWLSFLNRVEITVQTPIPTQITEFIDYMRNEKGLSEITINNRCKILRILFSKIKKDLDQFFTNLTPNYLDEILILEFHDGIYSRRSIKQYTSVLRTFLRYAECRGWCQSGIADSIKTHRNYAHQTIPSSPSWDNVRRLLETTEGDHPRNIRDRAILLLLIVYGLRSNEMRQLHFDALDWENETIRIKHSKHGPTQQFPLVQSVGLALIRYIKKARPKCSSHSEIFMTLIAPYRPLKNIFNMVARRWDPLNVAIKRYGPHSLRHACATRLINQGMSLKTIADQLGHRSLDSTSIYAKVDLTRLREVANFNMGGLS